MNEKMSILKKETTLALDSLFAMIFIIGLMNALLANMDRASLIADMDHISPRILLVINLVFNLSPLLILIQSLSSQ